MLSVNDQTFSSTVLESSQPVLVHFWAPWCGLCLLIHPLLSKVQSEWDGPLKLVSVNADENFKLANTYRLRNLPTLILFDQGQIIHRLEGVQGREELIKTLKGLQVNSFAKSA
ncbi:thioredoxin family protein [Aphanothece sacrum]|uniref:Thioredoxin n=1 Tax=Aphanothece sacrum FPU1 TaxID=1920663 RepID=A0A401IN91_APHSA|nr:thioredoxin domain-containing protein [Aphanothece sacrum]GBF82715.1 thioredoxin [Aphanothece sacrum FPU1]GBF84494.1 thioredoxin [Aphanothece sacrum FPU3]